MRLQDLAAASAKKAHLLQLQSQVEERERARQIAKLSRAAEGQAIKQQIELETSLIEASHLLSMIALYCSYLSLPLFARCILSECKQLRKGLAAGHSAEKDAGTDGFWRACKVLIPAGKGELYQGEAGPLKHMRHECCHAHHATDLVE